MYGAPKGTFLKAKIVNDFAFPENLSLLAKSSKVFANKHKVSQGNAKGLILFPPPCPFRGPVLVLSFLFRCVSHF